MRRLYHECSLTSPRGQYSRPAVVSPATSLHWVRGTIYDADVLHTVFHTTRFERRLDQAGSVHIRCWKISGAYGLARQTATIWLIAENLTISFHDQPLAHDTLNVSTDHRQLTDVRAPQLVKRAFRSSQLPLWELPDEQWRNVVPPKHMRPLLLWERGTDGVVQIVPTPPIGRRKDATTGFSHAQLTR